MKLDPHFVDDPARWIDAITVERARQLRTVTVEIVHHRYETSARPVLVTCSDGRDYVVKGRNAGRVPVNEQVVARLGRAMGAPVPQVALVDVPEILVEEEPLLSHFSSGLAHGSEVVQDVADSYLIDHIREAGNRIRFARLAVLWGWVNLRDRQYLYSETRPYLVYSADHGNSFPRGPEWSRRSLLPRLDAAPDVELADCCRFTPAELSDAHDALASMDNARIARAVAAPPDEWGIDITERVALATYLARQRLELLRSLTGIKEGR
jgi:hypothetical protein